MARQRKVQQSASIPLVPPFQASLRPQSSKPLVEVSDDETWGFIKQSGILDSQAAALDSPSVMTLRPGETAPEILAEVTPLSDEIFNAILLIMPFSAILLLMEMYLHVLSDVACSFLTAVLAALSDTNMARLLRLRPLWIEWFQAFPVWFFACAI